MKRAYSSVVVAVAAGLIAACGHEYSEANSTTTTAARPGAAPANADAIDSIVAARCEREARCDNIGPGKRYVSKDGCMTALRGDEMNSLTPSNCPRGVDGRQLNKCLADVRGERCENVLDTLGRLTNCNTGSLCP